MANTHVDRVVGLALVALVAGCGFSEKDGRGWTERVIAETPRIAQLAFSLGEAPVSTYGKDGRYPDWIGKIEYESFTWKAESKTAYSAHAIAKLYAGPPLRSLKPPVAESATIEIVVTYTVTTTPPPLIFLPAGRNLTPTRWYMKKINGAPSDETGGAADYREGG